MDTKLFKVKRTKKAKFFKSQKTLTAMCLTGVILAILAIILTIVTCMTQVNNETASANAYKVLEIIVMSFIGLSLLLELSGLIPFCIVCSKVDFSTFRVKVLRKRALIYYCINAGFAIASIALVAILLSMGNTVTGSDQTKFLIIMGVAIVTTIVCIIFKSLIMRNMRKSTNYVHKSGVYEEAEVEK